MSLIGSLNIGKTALATHQAALQVTSNNIANAGNPQYTRQAARIVPSPDYQLKPGAMLGTGVMLAGIERQIDQALEERIRSNLSDGESAATREQWLGRVESVFHAMGENYLSAQLATFFGSWSKLASTPLDTAQRQIVITNGQSLASTIRSLDTQLKSLQTDIDNRLGALAKDANLLADRVAALNRQIVTAEGGGGGTANALRDQRDAALKDLAALMDIQTQETGTGAVNVTVGSEPLIIGEVNRGIVLKEDFDGANRATVLAIQADNSTITLKSGQAGALAALRGEIAGVADQLDAFAGALIFELNHLHSQGQGLEGFTQALSTNDVDDPAAALNSEAAGLEHKPVHGSFLIQVRRKSDGGVLSGGMIQVDLDGVGADDSLGSLAAKLDAVAGVSASVVGGKLKIQSDSPDTEITFSEDHSYVLAALGINSFFTGGGSGDMAINDQLKGNPNLLAAAANGSKADNQTALAISRLADQPLARLGNVSLNAGYDAMISGVAVAAAGARSSAEAAAVVQETLTTQREALSGVSLDEEAVNLIREQRAYQAAARVIAAIDELMRTLLQLV